MNNRSPFSNIPPVVKNLLIINVLVLLAAWVLKSVGIDLVNILGMHHPASEKFMLHQVVTYMFMHSMDGFAHIFFNMFALWMFGRVLESVMGIKTVFYLLFCNRNWGNYNPYFYWAPANFRNAKCDECIY